MNQRIKQLRERLKLSQAEFGERIGLSQRTISGLEIGQNVSDRNFNVICSVFNVNPEWLRDGIGEMFNPPKETVWLTQLIDEYQLDDVEIAIFKSYLDLPHEMRQMVIAYCKNLLRNMQGVELADKHKPDAELTVAEKRRIMREELDAEEKGQTSLAFTGSSGTFLSKNSCFRR